MLILATRYAPLELFQLRIILTLTIYTNHALNINV